MSEQERRRRWIAACRLESLNVTKHTRICAKHFEGGLGPTNANPVPTIFDFPENLQRKEVKPHQDPEGRRLKNAATTSKIQKASKHQRQLLHDKAVQTDLSADQITRMEQAHFKLQNRRGVVKENCLWRMCNETIPRSSLILAHLHFRVFSCYSIGSSMKYWDRKNKTRAATYQENCDKGKPGQKRQLPLFDEFVMVLVCLRLSLLKKQIADRCSLSPSLLCQRSSPRGLLFCTMYSERSSHYVAI
ncbi:unnamed protein product [Porites lobata]|uniref:THAP-type domain-containing protein n=1 Tax=Porites lobata TaxID=104759 RepID=A0ABN8Q613_9CNID|nr:unnamed protein product [Porites lobata]